MQWLMWYFLIGAVYAAWWLNSKMFEKQMEDLRENGNAFYADIAESKKMYLWGAMILFWGYLLPSAIASTIFRRG